MFNITKSLKNSEKFLQNFSDPFKSDKIQSITFHIYKNRYSDSGKINMYASIDFQNGKTKGEHDIEADDFGTLVKKVEDFIENL